MSAKLVNRDKWSAILNNLRQYGIDSFSEHVIFKVINTLNYMELTQEYFDQQLKNLATKDDLKDVAKKADVEAAVSELAGIINETIAEPMERGFAELQDHKAVREEMQILKADVMKIKEALHLT